MGHWNINIDRDFVREGFDPASLENEDIVVTRAERLSADVLLTIVLTYVGGKLLDHLFEKSLEAATDKLWDFARSKNKRLRVEIEERDFDPRVQLVAAKIDSMNSDELREALKLLPATKRHSERVLDSAGEDLKDLWYVWEDGRWRFSYYTTASNELIESVDFDVYDRDADGATGKADV